MLPIALLIFTLSTLIKQANSASCFDYLSAFNSYIYYGYPSCNNIPTYNFNSSSSYYTSSFPSALASGVKQLSFETHITIFSVCPAFSPNGPFDVFTLSINVISTKFKLLRVSYVGSNTFQFNAENQYHTDLNFGQITSDATDPLSYQDMELAGSVDLANGKATMLMGLPNKNAAASSFVSYNPAWSLDSTTQIFVCVDAVTGDLLAYCQSRYTYFWYTYFSSDSAFQYYGAFNPVLVSLYTLTEGSTTNFTDSSPYNVPNGPTAWGSSQIATAPADSTAEGGVFFDSPDQFISLRKFNLASASAFLKASLTTSFWIRINQTSSGYIFRYKTSEIYSYPDDGFSILLNNDRTISAVLGNQTAATVKTTAAITLSAWTMVTVTFTLGLSNPYNSIYIYFSGTLVKFQDLLFWAPSSLATTYLMSYGDARIGGPNTFIGQIMNFQIFSPGSNLLMDPSCLSPPQTSCQLSLGVFGYGSAVCVLKGTCDSSCAQCSTSPPGICATCPAQKHLHFGLCVDDCFYYSNGSCLYGSCGGYYYPTNGTTQSNCIKSCSSYWFANSTCLFTCPSPYTPSQWGDISFCNFPCDSSSYYNSNGTCTSSCLAPYIQRYSGNIARYCEFPCPSGKYYFYPNQSCFANNCTHPHLIPRNQSLDMFCDPICQPSESLYPNGSCISACSAPYIKTIGAYIATCDFPCSNLNKYYFPTNQSCGSTCPSTYYIPYFDGSGYYCDENCHITQYAYANGTCGSQCPRPYLSNNDTFVAYCNFPCNTTSYLYPDSSCKTSCEAQYSSYDSLPYAKYCYGPCFDASMYYYPVEQACNSSCTSGYEEDSELFYKRCVKIETPDAAQDVMNMASQATQVIAGVASALTPGSSINILASISGKIFSNIKFFNISYSNDLNFALLTWKSSLSSLLSVSASVDMPKRVKEEIEERPVPYVFEKHEVSSSFLINFWDNIQILFMIVLILLGAMMLEWIFVNIKNRYLPVSMAQTLRTVIQNFLIIQLYSLYGDIMLFTVLNLRTLKLEYNLSLVSIGIALVFIGIMMISFGKHVKMLLDYQRDRGNKAVDWKDFLKKNAGSQILFKDFKDDSFSKQAFLLFLTCRDLASMLILTLLFEYPLVQVSLIMVLNLAMISYLLVKSPFRVVFDGFQQLFFEIVTLAVNVCLIILAILDRITYEERDLNIDIGKFIIYSNICFNFVTTSFLLFKIGVALRDTYRTYKIYSNKKKLKKKEITVKNRLSHQQSTMIDHPQAPKFVKDTSNTGLLTGIGSPELGPHSSSILQENRMILEDTILRPQNVSQIFQESDISFVKDQDISILSHNLDNSQIRLKKIKRKPRAVNILDESIGSPELSKMSSGPILLDLSSLDQSPLEPQPPKQLTEGERKVINRFGIYAKKYKKSLTGGENKNEKPTRNKNIGLWIQYMKGSLGKNSNAN